MFISVKGYLLVTVSGASMYPVLQDGEKVKVVPCSTYEAGDILVYGYEPEGILVHRLLRKQDGRYFCKGDNSFRIESVTIQQIVGKVIIERDDNNTTAFINDSLKIGVLFKRNRYNVEMTKLQSEYIEYYHKYLEHSD